MNHIKRAKVAEEAKKETDSESSASLAGSSRQSDGILSEGNSDSLSVVSEDLLIFGYVDMNGLSLSTEPSEYA